MRVLVRGLGMLWPILTLGTILALRTILAIEALLAFTVLLLLTAAALLRIARRLATGGFDDKRNDVLSLALALRGLLGTFGALTALGACHRLRLTHGSGLSDRCRCRCWCGGSLSRRLGSGWLGFRGLANGRPFAGGLGCRLFLGRWGLLELFAHVGLFAEKKNARWSGVERKARQGKEDTKKGVRQAFQHHRTP